MPWAVQHLFGGIDPDPDPHLWASMLYLIVGVVFRGTLPLVLRGLVAMHGAVASALVGRWESDDLAAEVAGLDASRGAAVQAERIDILPEQRPALDAVFDKKRMATAARNGFEADRARAGEQIENPGAVDAFRIGMAQNIEQALTRPVRSRPDVVGFWYG